MAAEANLHPETSRPAEAAVHAEAAFDRALDHMAAGQPSAAISLLHQALELAPGHAAATHALMRALEETGDLDAALALTRSRIVAEPDDALAHTRLSILLQRIGDIPAAEAAAARARILGWKHQLRHPQPESL